MGMFEPVACKYLSAPSLQPNLKILMIHFVGPAGSYCPPGGKEKLPCPEGHYCPSGTAFPIRCDVGAHCPESSQMNQSILPVAVLIIFDFVLIALIFLNWLRNRRKLSRQSHCQPTTKTKLPRPLFGDFKERAAGYKSLDGESEMISMEPIVYPRLRHVPMSFQAAINSEFAMSDRGANMDDPATSELQAFVRSLTKCIDGSNVGLSFGFSNLCCQPRGSARPILLGVTGNIAAGTMVGVMGGSGAGKCKCTLLAITSQGRMAIDHGSHLRECAHGKDESYVGRHTGKRSTSKSGQIQKDHWICSPG